MENIRITSGTFRGRTIKSPQSSLAHPMGSREKLALFNILSDSVKNATILDAYAGSGAIGFEALSRGAKHVTFIEKSPKTTRVIKENGNILGVNDIKIHTIDAAKFATDQTYDIIIADPPYDIFDITPIIYLTKYLKNDGILVVSHPSPTPVIPGFYLTTTKKYARANLSFFQKRA